MTDGGRDASERSASSLLRASSTYAVGSIAGKAIGAALLPILTRSLSPGDFGRYDVLSALATAVVSTLLLGFDVATVRAAAHADRSTRRTLVGTWLCVASTLAIVVAVFVVVLAGRLSSLLFGDRDTRLGVTMVAVVVVANTVLIVALTALRIEHRPPAYAAISVGYLLTNAAAILALFAAWERSTDAVMVAMAVAYSAGAFAAITVVRNLIGRPSPRAARRLFSIGLPLAPSMAATWLSDFANRAILLAATGTTAVGLFSVGFRYASLAILVVTGLQLAWQPHAFELSASRAGQHRIAQEARLIVTIIAAAVALLGLVAPEAINLIAGSDYAESSTAARLLLLYAGGTGVLLVASMPSAADERMGEVGAAALAAVVVTVLTNLFCARVYGVEGTAAAMAAGQFVGIALAARYARRSTLAYAWTPMVVVMAATIAVVIASSAFEPAAPRVLLGAVFMAILAAERAHAGTTVESRDHPSASSRSASP